MNDDATFMSKFWRSRDQAPSDIPSVYKESYNRYPQFIRIEYKNDN